jgi:hypothetical protein
LYSIKNETADEEAGVFIESITSELFSYTDLSYDPKKSFKLKTALGGLSNIIEHFRKEDRIAIQSNFEVIKLVPVLHKNTIKMLGMKRDDEYLAFKRDNDLFIALDKSQTLTTWSMTTCKIISSVTIEHDLGLQGF